VHEGKPLGVLDLDCLALDGFSAEDRAGLENIAKLIVDSSDW
jgi:L-methionine (R)-S-oxide reductase